ncbi:MAG TPA: homoserine kinase, partial [Bacteroidota bacterium]|nr:homoserine kinase [Bacteroidota bacterium]
RTEKHELLFSLKGEPSENLPATLNDNVAAHVARLLIKEFRPPFGIALELDKRMPIGSGLGSSAASSVAAVMAVNALLPIPLRKEDLLPFALEGERKTSGAPHADNAAPSLFGGVCLIRSYEPLDVVHLPVKNVFWWVVVHPHVVVLTKLAREVLPEAVPLKKAVRQWGNVGSLAVGLMTGDAALLGRSMEDVIVEPVRARLVPGFAEVKEAAMKAGAFGCTLSGSGPSIFALASSKKQAHAIGTTMKKTFHSVANLESDIYVSKVNMVGATVL